MAYNNIQLILNTAQYIGLTHNINAEGSSLIRLKLYDLLHHYSLSSDEYPNVFHWFGAYIEFILTE
jgi:hypothetical protein